MSQRIQTLLASNSKFFLEGIRKILKHEGSIKIVAEATSREETEKHLISIKPKLLLLDNRTLNLDLHELLDLTSKNGIDIKVILLGNKTEEELELPNILYINQETNSLELIKTIKQIQNKNIQLNIEKDIPEALPILYIPDIIELSEVVPSGISQPIEKESRSSVKELSLRKELDKFTDSHYLHVDEGRTKKQKEAEELGRETALSKDKIEDKRKFLIPPNKQFNHPGSWKKRRLPSFSKEFNRVVMLVLLISGFIYIGSNYFDGRTELTGSMREFIFSRTASEIKSNMETNLWKLWKQGYTDIKASVTKGKAVLSSKVFPEGYHNTTQNIVKSVEGISNYFDGRFTLKRSMEEIIFPPTDSGIKSDIETHLWKQGYRDIKLSVMDGKAALSGAISTEEGRHPIRNISDEEIASAIRKDLDGKGYKNIEVIVTDGKAILSGTLSSQKQSKVIQDIAMNTEGVGAVEDNLKILPKKEKQPIVKRRNIVRQDHLAYQDSTSSSDESQTPTKSEWRIRK